MTALVVIRAFGSYGVGQRISDAATVAALLGGSNAIYVVRTADDGVGSGGPVTPAQPSAVTIVSGVPDPSLGALYGYALDLTSTPATLYHWTGTAWAVVIQAGGSGGTPAPVLAALGLSTLAGTAGSLFFATISGQTSGSTLAATSADGTALTIANGALSGIFASTGQKQITITETLAGATGSPKQTALAVTIAAATPVLQALTLSAASFTAGAAAGTIIGAIQGLTAGSTLALADSHSGAVALSGSNLAVGASASAAGTFPITLTETLAGAAGSPKSTTLTITVGTASAPSVGTADFSDPNNSGLAGAL